MTTGADTIDIGKMMRNSANRRVLVCDQSGETHSYTTAEHIFTALFANAINKLQPKAIKKILKYIQMYVKDEPQVNKKGDGELSYVPSAITPERIAEWKALGYLAQAYPDDPAKIPEQVVLNAYRAEYKAFKAKQKAMSKSEYLDG